MTGKSDSTKRSSTRSRRRERSDLASFPRPSLAVDIAVLTVTDLPLDGSPSSSMREDRNDGPRGAGRSPQLAVLLLRRSNGHEEGSWALPGSFVRERERLRDAVLRTLSDKCGIRGLEPRQLRVFDDPDRDERGWVVSVAHVDVVPAERLTYALWTRDDLMLAPITPPGEPGDFPNTPARSVILPQGQGSLPFDHDQMVALAVDDLSARYASTPDPAHLLGAHAVASGDDTLVVHARVAPSPYTRPSPSPAPEPEDTFTMYELRRIHEAVLGVPLQKDTFRRQMEPQLERTEEYSDGTVGRPARLYRRRP